jgi:tripartite ATP-independent transporter DctP family solute receptor
MGTHTQCQEMVSTGTLDFYITTAGLVSVFDPKRTQELIELPYLFDNYTQAYAFMDTDFVTKIYEPLQAKGIRYLATWCNGFRHMTNSVRPIYTPADMKGLKVRVVKSEMSMKIISSLGASAVPMSYSELYTALSSGVVDGQENPFMNIYASKFYEVQKYMSLTKHQYSTLPLIFSEKTWKKLTDKQRKALKFGINPIQLGVVIVMVLAVGLFTPPVGQTLYISALIAGAPIEVVSRDILWFMGSIVIVVAMVIFINPMIMWLAAF